MLSDLEKNWKRLSLVLILILVFGMGSFQQGCRKITEPEQRKSIEQLHVEIEASFLDQIQAYFYEDEDLDEKIDQYEKLMAELGKAYYYHYVTMGNGDLEDAYSAMREFVLNFSVEGITLSEDSVEYYLEKVIE